ncbi:MAG: hypothetical protein JOZ38_11900 [Candidatus Eremiobacteraeota bacterium]|nr:hypothetical protein [Candidatus Eremiobacteraeota bacterium]
MGFNLGTALGGALTGLFTTGNPIVAGVEGVAGAFGGASGVGTAGNGIVGALNAASEADNIALMAENLRHQSAMEWQATWFDEMMDEKSETMRESNTLRDVDMEERKADNQITKKFIASITE